MGIVPFWGDDRVINFTVSVVGGEGTGIVQCPPFHSRHVKVAFRDHVVDGMAVANSVFPFAPSVKCSNGPLKDAASQEREPVSLPAGSP